ncbi:hypothetical protein SKAU_G00267650 [Synaphobranchus kaupii]|uniref:Uncharacterized protein n=1 Tax=Synaphobranchus kaupii TaxID=118154 RepID=A0A9Q1EZY3_SYNKA|nr:hypothetical protein SKAU_G00267650 [Synaphobranchus kaupii]
MRGDEEDEEDTRPLLSDDCHLYKSASLERSLVSGDNAEIPESRKPKKAVSYIQLPTRSILKNKRGQGGGAGKAENFRKAKSMEALSSRDERSGFGTLVGRPINAKDLEKKKEIARQNFVKEKLQFSAFLNEITRQVLSPSRLSSLGVTNAQRPANAGLTSPKSPREERRGQGYRQAEGKPRQQANKPGSPDSIASSAHSHCSGYSRSSQHQRDHHHCATCGTPQLQCHTSGSHTDASISPDNSPTLEETLRGGKQHLSGSNNLLTEGTNTSPELSPSLPRHHSDHSHGHHQRNVNAQHSPPDHPDQPKQAHHSPSQSDASPGTPVTPQESHPSRLDSPENIASSETKQTDDVVTEAQCTDVMSEVNRMLILQKQNEDLHHSLLQTAMRMDCMGMEFKMNHQQLEVDLQRTQLELENLKDKFKRLQDNYTSIQQTNQLFEQKLQTVSQNIGGERERLSKSVLELTEQLATAHTTIQSLEIINVPSFQEALGKRFEAEEAANQFLLPVASPPAQFMDHDHCNKILGTGDNQALGPVLKEEESDWSEAGEGIQQGELKGPGGGQPSVTAFISWKQEQGRCVGPKQNRKEEVEAGSESGRDEGVSRHPPRSLQIPHLQFTMYPETLSVPTADVSLARFTSTPNSLAGQGYGSTAMCKLGSPIRVLSANLGEICSTGVKQHHPSPAMLKCTEAMMNLHHPEGGTLGDHDEDEIFCNWRKRIYKGQGGGGCGDVGDYSEPGASLLSYQAAPRMVGHLVCQLQPVEVETQGWTASWPCHRSPTITVLKMKFPFEKRVQLARSLWLLSWLATTGASFTFTLGCFLKSELHRRSEVMDNTEIHAVPNTLMMVGLACMGINFFTGRICLDALEPSRFPRWKTFLTPFFGFSIFVTALMLASVIMSYAMKGNLEHSLKIGLKNGIRFYKDRCFQKRTIDRLQMEFRCCGNTDFKDWFEVQWISNRYLDFGSKEVKDRIKNNVDGRYIVDGVPFSCCNPNSPRPCIQFRLTNNSAHYNYDYQTEELNVHIRGCREALVNYYMGLMNSIGAAVLFIFLVQMTVLLSLRYLQTSMDAVAGQENHEIETEGYILEKGVKETIKEVMDPVLKVLLINQVDAAAGQKKAEEGEKPGASAT